MQIIEHSKRKEIDTFYISEDGIFINDMLKKTFFQSSKKYNPGRVLAEAFLEDASIVSLESISIDRTEVNKNLGLFAPTDNSNSFFMLFESRNGVKKALTGAFSKLPNLAELTEFLFLEKWDWIQRGCFDAVSE